MNLKLKTKICVTELENRKNSLAGQLDDQKQQLGRELGLERLRIEKSHSNLDAILKR